MDYNDKGVVPVEQGLNINQYELQENFYAFDRRTDLASVNRQRKVDKFD